MLVARREPFELGEHERPGPQAQQAPVSSRFTRAFNIVQMLGALVAVPAALGSAYTMYTTHYSVEATCQTLRANIVAMLDRNVDGGMRRALVRRDVETFERTCGAADPDATAAFKTLLAIGRAPPAAAASTAAAPAAADPAAPPQAAARKVETAAAPNAEPTPAPKPKQPPARAAAVAPVVPAPEAPMSDAAWLAAVRGALDSHQENTNHSPAAPTSLGTPNSVGEMPAPRAAPALPPPAPVAATPAPRLDPDHPVPPGAIPDPAPPDPATGSSRIGEVVSDIPFFGKALADHISR
jgi:hypothetical protein